MIPYGRHSVNEDDVTEVNRVLKSDWLTQGPKVVEFEEKLAQYCNTKFAVVASNGTAALQAAYFAAGISPGDEIVTSPMTFPATSNAAIWQGAKPCFVDIDFSNGNIDVDAIESTITKKTRVLAPVDYMGRPADLFKIKEIAKKYNLVVVEDACQALGAKLKGRQIGSISDLTVFSFHPVKNITTGEGGAILTDNESYYKKMKSFVSHGIVKQDFINPSHGEWYFEMINLGQNYRLTDIQSTLGISQLERIEKFLTKRATIANRYYEGFVECDFLELPPADSSDIQSAWHLFVVRLKQNLIPFRSAIFSKLRAAGIGVQVHHIPTYQHPYYQNLGYRSEDYPSTEKWYKSIISLPIYYDLTESEQDFVIEKMKDICLSY